MTMKCIRVVGQGVPVRLPDAEAHKVVVLEGDGDYCSKSFWKDWYRVQGKPPLVLARL
jgi:hypothetical protein